MKKFVKIVLVMMLVLSVLCTVVACAPENNPPDITPSGSVPDEDKIVFKTFSVDGDRVDGGKVSNATTIFDFKTEITAKGSATYSVGLDEYGITTSETKVVPLNVGNNTFYVFEKINGEVTKTYTVSIRRKEIYSVSFDSKGGTSIKPQSVEEDSLASTPVNNPERAGYTFDGWDFDFTAPITGNTAINAKWTANTGIPYKVEYYFENLGNSEYSIDNSYTVNKVGTTDTLTETPEIKTFDHFTYDESMSTTSGNINSDGSTALKLYYKRNTYTLSINDESLGEITNAGTYKYGTQAFASKVTIRLGYEFLGWYSGEERLSTDATYNFTADKNVAAKVQLKSEMTNFVFTSTATTCEISGLKQGVSEIIIPDYVTSIGSSAFEGCASLNSVTIGNSVTSIGDSAFEYCNSLTSITIPHSVTSIGDAVFHSCYSLTSVTIPDNVTSIGFYAFYNCTSLNSITIPNSVTSIGDCAFYNCTSLTSVTIGNGVTSIEGYAFYNTAYYNNESNWENGVLYIGKYLIKAKSDITGGCIIKEGTKLIADYAFYNRYSLTSITIPDSVTSIGDGAFYNCTSRSITFEGTKAEWNAISKDYGWNYYGPATVVHCTDGDVEI